MPIRQKSPLLFKILVGLFMTVWVSIFAWAFIGRYLFGMVAFDNVFSEGDRVGQVVKISRKGLIWKTWEVTMGVTQSGSYIDSWNFSVDEEAPNRDELVDSLHKAYSSGAKVKVHYIQKLGVLPWRGETDYFIQNLEFFNTPYYPASTSPTPKPGSR